MLDYKSIEQIIKNQNEEEMLINMYNSFLNCKKYKIALEALIIKKEQDFNHQLYDIERLNYNDLLDKIVALAHELHLSNSLAYCLLFSYLVWHGYCSYNKSFTFSKDLNFIHGLYGLDVILGHGVCVNISYMLADFINRTEYVSKTISGYYYSRDDFLEFLKSIFLKPNHEFNVIQDNGIVYGYDATNRQIFNFPKPGLATNSDFCIKVDLDDNLLLQDLESKKLKELLEQFLNGDYKSFRDAEIEATKQNFKEIISANRSLVQDYYEDARTNIDTIYHTLVRRKNG